jgi:hypothetical protein
MRRLAYLAGLIALAGAAACGGGSSSSDGGGDPVETCTAGEAGCDCLGDGSCNALLTCEAGSCVACVDGKDGCGCLANATCDAGLACVGDLCEPCPEGSDGCACVGGTTCDGALACQNGFCVTVGACTEGTLDCACGTGGLCATGLTCSAGYCRTCTSDVVGCPCDVAGCTGLVCGADELCREPWTCATLPVSCGVGQTCVEGLAGEDASCQLQCPPCNDAAVGEDGPWPTPTLNGICICKTLPGWFYTSGMATGIFPCDKDGDGWVRDTAQFAINNADPAIQANARCDLRRVGQIVLHNEDGQTLSIPTLLGDGKGLPLFETVRNDDQSMMDTWSPQSDVPAYGATGRRLQPSEVNGFTKACAGANADFNHNGVKDVAEWGAPSATAAGSQAAPVGYPVGMKEYFEHYTRFSYFLELYRGWYEPSPDGPLLPGSYHLAEKRRPIVYGDNFPLRYGQEEASGQWTSDYWQSCDRGRDTWYAPGSPTIGMDFASLSDPNPSWRGLKHHSQFKCVQVIDELTYVNLANRALARHLQSPSTLAAAPASIPSTMSARDYLDATPNACDAQPDSRPTTTGSIANPREPVIACSAVTPRANVTQGQVLWVGTRVNTDATKYARGCIFQCAGYPRICPGSDPTSPAARECFYMCADTAASGGGVLTSPDATGYSLRGEVPVAPIGDGELTGSTYTIRAEPLP